ncbi:bacteriophage abortive infection AbiH family protein [Denitratisoma oestradiolicum]|uniref:Abortive infection AbiH-like protein n=1 Tax=Denitratisoma oestradiolicum TaxID=311182 RepID=A0A6S6Y687_9PROT|nr:bacteriophage abortive infection AbiH family protein [Denitratisoma oestradiolicum]CAB1367190.1 Abortive infection AbiH-like protein [Denitratisoma oestradiolicum]CAB1371099.1 Abortive infection AbiH-like protein [Denitratisoma oestradiolicum]
MNDKLYVIGNGFDLHHRMPTQFSDFRTFARKAAPDVFRAVDDYVPVSANWSDLENALAALDVETVKEDLSCFMPSYAADDWRDSGHHDFQFEVDRVVRQLSVELRSVFARWVRQIKVPDLANAPGVHRLTSIDRSASFLTFNYTPTLADLYGVPLERTLHIHGTSSDDDQELVLGHGWNSAMRKSLNDRPDIEDVDTRMIEANQILDRYFTATFKPSKQLIAQHQEFFRALDEVTHVTVLGHSLSNVDAEYFRALLAVPAVASATWTVACRHSDDAAEKTQRLVNLGLPASQIRAVAWTSL